MDVKVFSENLVKNIGKAIIGKSDAVEMAVIGLLCQGHLLIEDVPGVGKTMMARAIAKTLGCSFNRLQFTPDMLPSDVTGVSIFNQVTREFEFRPGPVMAQIVLADEINRATPKTQAALLEAMQEQQITVDGITHPLPRPFMVLATQNPIEYEGTFPLPEAQLDRFMLRLRLGYPGKSDEVLILGQQQYKHPLDYVEVLSSADELVEAQQTIRGVHVAESLKSYIVDIASQTRQHPDVYLGASPRGSLSLFRGSQARAALQGRNYVLPDDIKALALPALAHRVILSPSARLRDTTEEEIVKEVLDRLPVPGGDLKPSQ